MMHVQPPLDISDRPRSLMPVGYDYSISLVLADAPGYSCSSDFLTCLIHEHRVGLINIKLLHAKI